MSSNPIANGKTLVPPVDDTYQPTNFSHITEIDITSQLHVSNIAQSDADSDVEQENSSTGPTNNNPPLIKKKLTKY